MRVLKTCLHTQKDTVPTCMCLSKQLYNEWQIFRNAVNTQLPGTSLEAEDRLYLLMQLFVRLNKETNFGNPILKVVTMVDNTLHLQFVASVQ